MAGVRTVPLGSGLSADVRETVEQTRKPHQARENKRELGLVSVCSADEKRLDQGRSLVAAIEVSAHLATRNPAGKEEIPTFVPRFLIFPARFGNMCV